MHLRVEAAVVPNVAVLGVVEQVVDEEAAVFAVDRPVREGEALEGGEGVAALRAGHDDVAANEGKGVGVEIRREAHRVVALRTLQDIVPEAADREIRRDVAPDRIGGLGSDVE